jgi:4a-hydroxytetrahydrobiopterin dehydratase
MHVIWTKNRKGLCCSLLFPDFPSAMAFVQELSVVAERINHHPDWRNVYRQLDICLHTHDEGNRVTEKDIALSEEINRILLSYTAENRPSAKK